MHVAHWHGSHLASTSPTQPMLRNMLGLDRCAYAVARLVVKAFTSRAVEGMQPRIEAVADELLDSIDSSRGARSISSHYADAAIRVISDLLGI